MADHRTTPTASAAATVTSVGTFASTGVTLHRVSVSPADPALVRARLAIVHGYGDHAGRYAEFMGWLAARGVACHAFDLRGHGRSEGRRAYVKRWDDYLDDLRAFLALPVLGAPSGPQATSLVAAGGSPRSGAPETAAPVARPHAPLFLLGHSHGGLIVAAAGVRKLLPPGVAGCVLSAPYLVNCLAVPAVKVAAAHVLDRVVPWLRVPSGVRPGMMSGDPGQVAESRNDPLLLRSATPRWFLTHRVVQADTMTRAGDFAPPLMVLYGDADPIADPRGAAEFHARAASADKTLRVYPGFRHEPLREAGRERVFADVLEWVERRSGSGDRDAS